MVKPCGRGYHSPEGPAESPTEWPTRSNTQREVRRSVADLTKGSILKESGHASSSPTFPRPPFSRRVLRSPSLSPDEHPRYAAFGALPKQAPSAESVGRGSGEGDYSDDDRDSRWLRA